MARQVGSPIHDALVHAPEHQHACAGKGAATGRSKLAKGGKCQDPAANEVDAPPAADMTTKAVSGAAAAPGTDTDAVPAAASNYRLPKGKAKKGKKKRAKK